MEGLTVVQEIYLLGKEAHLGWIYNSSTTKCSPPEVSKDYKFEEFKSYEWLIFDKSNFEKMTLDTFPLVHGNAPWFKDYQNSSAHEIIRVQMIKMDEKRACEDIVNECNEMVVTSLFYKAYINVLLFYDVSVAESFKNDMKYVLDSITNEKEVELPKTISNGLIESRLYDGNTPYSSNNTVWLLKEACRHLKDKIVVKPTIASISNGIVVGKLLTDDICMVKYECCKYQSDNIIDHQTKALNDKTELNVRSYAQITSVKNPFDSISRKCPSFAMDIPVEIHSPTKKGNLVEEIINQLEIKEGNQSKVLNLQSKITSEKGRSRDSQRVPLNGSHISSMRASRGHNTQTDATKQSEYTATNSKYDLRDRSTLCRKRETSCRKENQEVSRNTRGNISQGRKAYQEQNGNIVTFELSESQSVSHISGIECNRTYISTVGNISMPKIPNSLSENSNSNIQVSRDDNCKNITNEVNANDQNSYKLVPQHEKIYKPVSDEYFIVLNDSELQNKNSVTADKAMKVDSEIDNKNSGHAIDIATNSPCQSDKGLISTCEKETEATGIQETPNIPASSQTTKCVFSSFDRSKDFPNSQNNFQILDPLTILIDPCGMKRHYYGNISSSIEEKVILLLGASGSGKTTLVNFIANYFEGVKTPDDKTVIVAPTSDKTKEITAYTFCNENDPATVVTVIDTPGLNDSSGSEIRDHVNSLKTFLANTASYGLKIHALGFVAQAHLVRLTSSERLVMDYVSTLFGEGVKDNIITFISFADVQQNPPVVEAMKHYGIKTKNFLKFNNAVLNGSSVEVDEMDRVYWRTGYRSWKKGMKILNDLLPLSINAMKALQNEVYTKSVVESSVKAFRGGLIDFFSIYNEGNPEEIRNSSHQVWDLATVAHYHLRQTPEGSISVEILLLTSVDKFCFVSQSVNPSVYLRALSYYSPRGIDECAQAIIESIHPIYVSSKNIKSAKVTKKSVVYKKKKSDKEFLNETYNFQEQLYCHHCQKDHAMERIEDAGMIEVVKKTFGYKQAALITYKCTECKCEGNVHGVNPLLKSEGITTSFGSNRNDVLYHTKDRLSNLVNMCLPDINMTVTDLLKFLLREANEEAKEFVNALLEVA